MHRTTHSRSQDHQRQIPLQFSRATDKQNPPQDRRNAISGSLNNTRSAELCEAYLRSPAAPPSPAALMQFPPITPSSSLDGVRFGAYSPDPDEASERYATRRIYSASSDSSSVYSQPEWMEDPQRPTNMNAHFPAEMASSGSSTRNRGAPNSSEWESRDDESMRFYSQNLPSPLINHGLQSKKPAPLVEKGSSPIEYDRDSIANSALEVTSPRAKHHSSSSSISRSKRPRADLSAPGSPVYTERPKTIRSPFSSSWNLSGPSSTRYEDSSRRFSGPARSPKPDTPMSPKSGLLSELSETLQVGSEQLEAAFLKVKRKLSVKPDAEKRHEMLKRTIKVVTASDRNRQRVMLAQAGEDYRPTGAPEDEGAGWI